MTTQLEQQITSLARLDMTPEQIIADARAPLLREIEELKEQDAGWFQRFALSRLAAMRDHASAEKDLTKRQEAMEGTSIALFLARSIQCLAMVILFLEPGKFAPTFLVISALLGTLLYLPQGREDKQLLFHWIRNLLLPLTPFLHLFDWWIVTRPAGYFDAIKNQIKAREAELTKLALHEIVPTFYRTSINLASQELLGNDSELRKTECNLRARLESIRAKREQIRVRRAQAVGDPDRESILAPADEALLERQRKIEPALAHVEATLAKTTAIFDECRTRVSRLSAPLEDALLVQQIEADAELDALAVETAYAAVTRHVQLIRHRLYELATVVSLPAPALSATSDIGLEDYFTHVDRVAEKIAAIEVRNSNT